MTGNPVAGEGPREREREADVVHAVDVYKGTHLAARISRHPGGSEFRYLPEYLDADLPAVATTLPLGAEPRLTQAGAVPSFFAGLLPEGRRLTHLRRALKASADDELSLLAAVGADMIGDVRVAVRGALDSAGPRVVVDRDFSELRFQDLLADNDVVDPYGIPGVQEKVSAQMISVPVRDESGLYILKLTPPEYPHLVENELYFMNLAREAGLKVATVREVRDADDVPGLLVSRFDRVRVAGALVSLGVEDGCQILDRWPADKYNVSMLAVARALTAVCSARPVAALAIFRQIVFAWLTGNGDLHAKNIAVLERDGEWAVAPAYDLPSTVPYGDRTLALSVGGRRTGVSRRMLLEFAAELGLPQKAAVRHLDRLLDATEPLIDSVAGGALPFDETATIKLIKELRNRRRLLLPT